MSKNKSEPSGQLIARYNAIKLSANKFTEIGPQTKLLPTFWLIESNSAMYFRVTLFILGLSAPFIWPLNGVNFHVEQSSADDSVVLGVILTNFLIKYFRDDSIFVSIVLGPSKPNQTYLTEDFFDELFDDAALTEFAYNVCYNLNNTISDRHYSFNIIFVNDFQSLG